MSSPTSLPTTPPVVPGRRARLLGVVFVLALGGCTLIDQTTFAPAPGARPAAPAAPAVAVKPPPLDSRTPLLTIGADTPADDYRALLRFAVGAAQRRDRNVRFDVMAVAPDGPTGTDTAALRASLTEAAGVMREIAAAGVPADRIRLHAAPAPDATRGEVRVYVR